MQFVYQVHFTNLSLYKESITWASISKGYQSPFGSIDNLCSWSHPSSSLFRRSDCSISSHFCISFARKTIQKLGLIRFHAEWMPLFLDSIILPLYNVFYIYTHTHSHNQLKQCSRIFLSHTSLLIYSFQCNRGINRFYHCTTSRYIEQSADLKIIIQRYH